MHGEREPSKTELLRADALRAHAALLRALGRRPSLLRRIWWLLVGR